MNYVGGISLLANPRIIVCIAKAIKPIVTIAHIQAAKAITPTTKVRTAVDIFTIKTLSERIGLLANVSAIDFTK